MSDPTFLADGSGIAPHIPLAKVRKVGLGGGNRTCRLFPATCSVSSTVIPRYVRYGADVTTRRPSSRKPAGNAGGR